MSRHARVLISGPSSPPPGGIASVIEAIFGSELRERYELVRFETTPLRAAPCGFAVRVLDATMARGCGFDGVVNRETFAKVGAFRAALAMRPDLVHLHSSHGYDFWLSAFLARDAHARGVPAILHVHGNFDVEYPRWTAIRRAGFRRALRELDRLVVLSEGWRRWFAAHLDAERIDVVRNGVDVARFAAPRRAPARDLLRLLFVGTRHPEVKGADDLLAVIPELVRDAPNLRFVFVGSDPEQLEARRVRGTQLARYCEFVGWQDPQQIVRYFEDADVLLMPSRMEAAPIALLEAMAAGLPVIASRVGAVPEMMSEPENGILIPPRDRPALARAILDLARDPLRRERIGRANRAKAEAEFDLSHVVARTEQVYERVLAEFAQASGRNQRPA